MTYYLKFQKEIMMTCDLEIKLQPIREIKGKCVSTNEKYSSNCQIYNSTLVFFLIGVWFNLGLVAILQFFWNQGPFCCDFHSQENTVGCVLYKGIFSIIIELYIKKSLFQFYNIRHIKRRNDTQPFCINPKRGCDKKLVNYQGSHVCLLMALFFQM